MTGLFGTSGIRRKISELPPEFAVNLGRALGAYAKSENVVVGRDTRKSGPLLESSFISGLLSAGKNVLELGVVPTPTVGVGTSEHGAGVMITASHNPPEYNGFKFWDKNGAFSKNQEEELESVFIGKKFAEGKPGEVRRGEYIREHIKLILRRVGTAEDVKVMLDCSGGSGSTVTPLLLEEMGCKVKVINDNRDGRFPHPLEPTKENLEDTCSIVKKEGVDIAFAHDGDADRTCAIDGNGNLIEWDTFLTVLASQSKKVVTTVDASMRIEEFCDKVYRVPVGDVAVADGIRKYGAGFGGEPSGTYIFPDVHIFPDGIATVGKALKLAAEGVFYKLVEEIPTYPMERVKIPCRQADKQKIMGNLEKNLKGLDYSDIDGIRIQEDDGWILIRPSGTEDYVRITAEAKTQKKLDELVKKGKQWIKESC
ncbi:MAG: phosphoglucosamine mutase [Candidatus Altiarchaeota archaeon]